MAVEHWLEKAREISIGINKGYLILEVYETWLRLIQDNGWTGACHDTSAGMFMAMHGVELAPELIIGIVEAPSGKLFDHSWVEVNGLIFDAAVGYPNPDGEDVSAPIFASRELETGKRTLLRYGVTNRGQLSEPAHTVASCTLAEYGQHCDLWEITSAFWCCHGRRVDPNDLRRRFGGLRRTVRGSIL
ncbi:hypothetical protein ACFO0E_10470 [Chromohalobacter beijerinckii]|uniref:Transglutaminase-like superfamily protein n=1 Tax=Chromohalobacter beijerinckii TaxID=86179 RepID=A0ABV8XFN4_9GAMM|nr:hypothetical protein [Chromohalobacter beijerinckii]MCK0765421.1 hypothetical protein [Chromohalobacter beijerinckii]